MNAEGIGTDLYSKIEIGEGIAGLDANPETECEG
jgi:hypothetical protein